MTDRTPERVKPGSGAGARPGAGPAAGGTRSPYAAPGSPHWAPAAPESGASRGAQAEPESARVEGRALLVIIAIAGAALLSIALFAHPVGDYHAESDFYGGYADGARQIERGHLDPARYPVVGPVYELTLALLGFLPLDLFLLAKLLSVLSACVVIAALGMLARARAPDRARGATLAVWLAVFLIVNPTFLRYGYSATNDMLSLALASLALWALFTGPGIARLALAGALAGLAALTRYSEAILLPGGALALALWPPKPSSRRRAVLAFAAGFAVIVLPWTVFSVAHHAIPGEPLFRYFSFYANPDPNRSIQDFSPATPDSARAYRSLGDMLRTDAGGLAGTTLRNIPAHLVLDARKLIGWPAAALAALGVVFALISRSGLGLVPLWAIGALQFLMLAPVFFSERYALPLVPIELSLAAFAMACLTAPAARALAWIAPFRRAVAWIAPALGVAVAALGLRDAVPAQREVHRLLPFEVLDAGRALKSVAGQGSRVIARKGQIGYYAGVPVVPFPRVATLGELALYARSAHADYLYYSWYEAQLRPEFAWLLDSSATTPGLSVLRATTHKRSVLYRIGPGFGWEPAWLADSYLKRLHESRALVGVIPDSLAVPYLITLGVDALDRRDPREALARADQALRFREDQALAWQVRGLALMKLGRARDAVAALERAHALAPGDAETADSLAAVRARGGR